MISYCIVAVVVLIDERKREELSKMRLELCDSTSFFLLAQAQQQHSTLITTTLIH